ncbi:zinc-binding dehydrogenase [Amycolatopsis sp. NPDC051102]|uniref:quinone oxidoreductase family protein n=1 Tax=Amycolatopsis sp. NPDC051102 TaxID=3155163 RepID=UPI003434D8DE
MRSAVVQPSGELELSDLPDPVAGPGQVVVETEAIGAGFVDVMLRRGEYLGTPATGAVPGVEVVGEVRSAGPDVPDHLVGRRVLALPSFGGYADLVVADAGRVLPVPDGADAADAVALGVNALVAEIALGRAGVKAGDRALVRGASGGIGVLATQIAAARGAEVTAVTSSAAWGERLRTLGAGLIIDRTADVVPEREYDVVVDTVAGPGVVPYVESLRDNGRYVLCGGAGGLPSPEFFPALLRRFHTSPTLVAFSLNSVASDDLQTSWQAIVSLWTQGSLSPVVDRRFPLSKAPQALRLLERGGLFGKVVLAPKVA